MKENKYFVVENQNKTTQLLTDSIKSLGCSAIPSGMKENKYFVVENQKNTETKTKIYSSLWCKDESCLLQNLLYV